MSTGIDAIGGYFGLELPLRSSKLPQNAIKYQSARAAFLSLLRQVKPSRVWLPSFICDAMVAPIKEVGAGITYYPISDDLTPLIVPDVCCQEVIVLVNYFGLCAERLASIIAKIDPAKVVMDYSQSFFAKPLSCLATIYSPRKFFGIPDGGLLVTDLGLIQPANLDRNSEFRSRHLLRRLNRSPEEGFVFFNEAEKTLEDLEPKSMSSLTNAILTSIDFDEVRARRNHNFLLLNELLGDTNEIGLTFGKVNGPLCYPYLINNSELKSRLIERRIFVPTFWPEVLGRVPHDSVERSLVERCALLPCDQRYSQAHMKFLARTVSECS